MAQSVNGPPKEVRRIKFVGTTIKFLRCPSLTQWLTPLTLVMILAVLSLAAGCRDINGTKSVRPRTMSEVPAERLAYRFEADIEATPAVVNRSADAAEQLAPVRVDFEGRRKDDALLRTVLSPDGQRALALYATAETPEGEFLIDLYSADGLFLRNITPSNLSCAFPSTVAWSPDSGSIAFIGRKSLVFQAEQQTAPPLGDLPSDRGTPDDSTITPVPLPTVAPLIAPVAAFSTEQIYICDRDGYDLRPLTTRDGLIYFNLTWAPDSRALAALACKETEWEARAAENLPPAGRPRIIHTDGRERLLDDGLAEAPPVWSPDSSKVAAASATNITIYDAAPEDAPTGARIPLHDPLLAASARYDEAHVPQSANNQTGTADTTGTAASDDQTSSLPLSFNPVIRLEWPEPETLLMQTGFVRIFAGEPVSRYLRWHTLHLSPQAALLSKTFSEASTKVPLRASA